VRAPDWTLKNTDSSSHEDVKHLRRAVALSRQGKLEEAINEISKAQRKRPKDAYLQDLKAELYMRHKKFDRAAKEYQKAADLDGTNALILAGYGRALLASNQTNKALSVLKTSRQKDFRNIRMLRDLAVAYSKTGQNGMASLITAERFALQGKTKDAKIHARRALDNLPRGSPGWQSAEDILDIK
jgi:predicted Zn-dependent protease